MAGSLRTTSSVETASGWAYTETFRLATLTSGHQASPDPVTAAGAVYALSDLPLGAEVWFQFVNDPVTGTPFASPRWYLGTVEGTPDTMRLDPRGGAAPVTYATTTLYTELPPAVLEWFGEGLAEQVPVGTPTSGAPAVFRGPDGIPLNGSGTIRELGAAFLSQIAGRVVALAPVGRPVTDPWVVIRL